MRRRGAVLGVVLAAALSGCGATPLSVKELRASAGRICACAAGETERVPGPTPAGASAPSAQALAQFLRSGAVILERELGSLHRLNPSRQSASQYREALSAMSGQIDALRSSERNLMHGGDAVIEIKALQQRLEPLNHQASAAWQALGVQACAGQ